MQLYGSHKVLAGLGALLLLIVTLIIWLCDSADHPSSSVTEPHVKRNTVEKDKCLQHYGGLELNYIKGSTTSFKFDLCDIINCGGRPTSWRGYDVYLCQLGWPSNHQWCPSWDHVWQATNRDFNPKTTTADGKIKTAGYFHVQRDYSTTLNPITLSIDKLKQNPYPNMPSGGCWGKSDGEHFYFLIGVDVTGKDPMALLKINLIEKPQPTTNNGTGSTHTGTMEPTSPIPASSGKVQILDYTQFRPSDLIQMATGYSEDNLWLEWVAKSAKEHQMGDCIACASARPHLVTVPAPLFPEQDSAGYKCMTGLTKGHSQNCTTLASLFPPISNDTVADIPFTPSKANGSYICFNFTTPRCNVTHKNDRRIVSVGSIDPSWCNVTRPGEEIGVWARAGLYYYCGRHRLYSRIRSHTQGICAMIRLKAPLMLIGNRLTTTEDYKTKNAALTRTHGRHVLKKRAASGFDLSINSPTYIDAIGVPRGVPDEFKLVDQVAAGFENIPIVSALFPVTPNKNVDRINYVHYNVLRLANLTRDAVEGLVDQLHPTSMVARQNRIALDMLLAEKGGVCAMFGDLCCTVIPNNTAPDGSVTKALEGLRSLSKTMHEQSGVKNSLEAWMTRWFGQWKGIVMSLLISLATFMGIIVTCGCCCIPCLRSLSLRLITTAIEGKSEPYMMSLLAPPQDEEHKEEQVELREIIDL